MTGQPQLIEGASLDEIYLTIMGLAEFYGVNDETVRLWEVQRRWIGRSSRGFQLKAAVQGIYRGQLESINRKKGTAGEEITQLELREQTAKTEKAEIEVRRLQGDLISAEEVKSAAFEQGRLVRDRLENVPSRISAIAAAETDEQKIRELIAKEIHQALEELSQQEDLTEG